MVIRAVCSEITQETSPRRIIAAVQVFAKNAQADRGPYVGDTGAELVLLVTFAALPPLSLDEPSVRLRFEPVCPFPLSPSKFPSVETPECASSTVERSVEVSPMMTA